MSFLLVFLLVCQAKSLDGHHFMTDKDHIAQFRNFSQSPGVLVSFNQHRIVSGDFFLGFHGWDKINRKYGASNVTFIVRIEFDRWTYRHQKLNKTYHRYWIPGALWVEKVNIGKHFYNAKFNHTRSKNSSVIDIWVEPKCFLRNHGISRIYRVTRSLRMHVYNIRWIAKVAFAPGSYDSRELKQFGKFLTQLNGIDCAWLHPRIGESTPLLIKFDTEKVTGKRFFSPEGYHEWDELNDRYQVVNVGYLRGWNRAVLEFAPGLHCKDTTHDVGLKYAGMPGISAVYRDEYQNCRLTFRLLVKFNPRHMSPASIHYYNDWSSLNYMYGVVNISYHQDSKLIAHLEFEPGIYTNHQMKAIRSEYLKLHGILFAWVEGVYPTYNSRMVIKLRVDADLADYAGWNILNSNYFVQVLSFDHNANTAVLEIPQGRFSEHKIQEIYQEYRELPKVISVTSLPFQNGGGRRIARSENEISSLRRTIWVPVTQQKKQQDQDEMDNETKGWSRYTPLYHSQRNNTENSLWEDHCDFH